MTKTVKYLLKPKGSTMSALIIPISWITYNDYILALGFIKYSIDKIDKTSPHQLN